MSLKVKICGITSPQARDAAIQGGAAFLGFVFHKRSPRFLARAIAANLAAAVPQGVTRVGLFVDAEDDVIAGILDSVPLDMLQFHGAETPERVAAAKSRFGKPVMKAIGVAGAGDLAAAASFSNVADWLLFDAKPAGGAASPGGNARAFDWHLLAGLAVALPWMLAGGLTATNLPEAVQRSGAAAVDVSSGVERAPGLKDPAKIAAFLATAAAL
jgi:phosphoribosylanthranilate isomerase